MDSSWVHVGVITSIWDSVQTTILLRPRSACTLNFSTILPAIWSLLCPPPDGLELTQNRTLVTAPDGALRYAEFETVAQVPGIKPQIDQVLRDAFVDPAEPAT